MNSMLGIALAAVVVGLLAWMLRRAGTRDESLLPPVPEAEVDDQPLTPDPVDIEEEDDDDVPAGMIAVTSDGLAFVPRSHGVLIAPAHRIRAIQNASDDAPILAGAAGAGAEHQVAVLLKPGDLIAARVERGSPDLDPWRLETLGRDRDLTSWIFEVPEAAEAARELLAQRVVQPPRDEHGDPIPVGDEDFWVAERELAQTLAALDQPDPIDEDETPRGR